MIIWKKFNQELPPLNDIILFREKRWFVTYENGKSEEHTNYLIGYCRFSQPCILEPEKYLPTYFTICIFKYLNYTNPEGQRPLNAILSLTDIYKENIEWSTIE